MPMISSKENPRVKQLSKLQKSARFRRQSGLFIAEGLRICRDAMKSGAEILTLYVTERATEKYPGQFGELQSCAGETILLSPSVFASVSDTQTPQGFLCTIKTLDKTIQFDTIKTAEAFGISGVILSADCCDIYNPKVVRGSMGAVFRVPFHICEGIPAFLSQYNGLCSYAAVVDRDAEKISEISFREPCVTVIGNEGNGLTKETIAACDHRVTIPMKGKAESLNASAAATVIIWEMLR